MGLRVLKIISLVMLSTSLSSCEEEQSAFVDCNFKLDETYQFRFQREHLYTFKNECTESTHNMFNLLYPEMIPSTAESLAKLEDGRGHQFMLYVPSSKYHPNTPQSNIHNAVENLKTEARRRRQEPISIESEIDGFSAYKFIESADKNGFKAQSRFYILLPEKPGSIFIRCQDTPTMKPIEKEQRLCFAEEQYRGIKIKYTIHEELLGQTQSVSAAIYDYLRDAEKLASYK